MTGDIPIEGFETIATNPEVIHALLRSGISEEVLGATLGVSDKTVSRWQRGEVRPRHNTEIAIDDIRAAMAMIIAKGFAAEEAATIVQAARAEPPHEPYIEFIVREPDIALRQISKLTAR